MQQQTLQQARSPCVCVCVAPLAQAIQLHRTLTEKRLQEQATSGAVPHRDGIFLTALDSTDNPDANQGQGDGVVDTAGGDNGLVAARGRMREIHVVQDGGEGDEGEVVEEEEGKEGGVEGGSSSLVQELCQSRWDAVDQLRREHVAPQSMDRVPSYPWLSNTLKENNSFKR